MEGSQDKAFFGKGWSFPIKPDKATNDVLMAAYEEDIRQAILLILETNNGERVMRPEFGSGLREMIFEPINTTTMSLVRHRVEEALITWEPRINLKKIKVTADRSIRNRINIEINYEIRTTNTFYNLVYPFYLQEGQP